MGLGFEGVRSSRVMDIAKNLLSCMRSQRLTYAELEKRSGVPRSTLHGWASGRSVRDMEALQLVAGALGVGPWELVFGSFGPVKGFRLRLMSWGQFLGMDD